MKAEPYRLPLFIIKYVLYPIEARWDVIIYTENIHDIILTWVLKLLHILL